MTTTASTSNAAARLRAHAADMTGVVAILDNLGISSGGPTPQINLHDLNRADFDALVEATKAVVTKVEGSRPAPFWSARFALDATRRSDVVLFTDEAPTDECTCVVSCADDPATVCSLSGEPHVHPQDRTGCFGPCPVHPDAAGDL